MALNYPVGCFGPRHADVVDVYEVALSDRFLAPSPRVVPAGVVAIESLDAAIALPGPVIAEMGNEPLMWADALAHQRRQYVSPKTPMVTEAERREIEDCILRLDPLVCANVERQLGPLPRAGRGVASYAAGLFGDVAMHRAFVATRSRFWEIIFVALRSGGIPVGWSGPWPDGQLVAYYHVQARREHAARDS